MDKKTLFHVKMKSLTWKNYILTIGEKELQLQKENKNTKPNSKPNKIQTYSLINAVVLDRSEKTDLKILICSPLFRLQIKILNITDKNIILSKLEEIVKKNSAKTAFSKEYLKRLQDISNHEEKNPFEAIISKINTYKILMGEINIQLSKFKNTIKEKLSGSLTGEFLSIQNDLNTIALEMKKQFNKIDKGVKKYLLVSNDKAVNESDTDNSDSSSEEEDKNSNNNIIQKKNSNQFYFLSSELIDFYNPNYDFKERVKMPKNIKCPENMLKEMVTIYTKKQSSPVYFNEPLSMGQKQCEKFFYLDMLTKASKQIKDKPLQMCYICAFIIGEIFLNIGRFLKPFSPIIGETYEYFENYHKFRYYSEQVKHKPQITAFIGETPDFAYYGDTLSESSFKFLKGIELSFKNKVNIFLKNSGSHYVYNRPSVCIKGLMKPPMYNDYSGTTVIQDVNDKNVKCELNFFEQSWISTTIGDFEGKAYSSEGEVKYLIGGNWQKEIYITDPEGKNKQVLLSVSKNTTYLGNTMEKYTLPFYSCNLNFINEDLRNSLPKNDSRFRKDMRLMEKGEEFIPKAQIYKNAYEEKQRKELKDEDHQILFFIEKKDEETEDNYYIPNGQYWEMKKDGRLKENKNKNIFEVEEYLKREEEKEKERLENERKEKEEKEKKEKEEKEKKEKEEKERKEKEEKEKKEKEEEEKQKNEKKDKEEKEKEKNEEIINEDQKVKEEKVEKETEPEKKEEKKEEKEEKIEQNNEVKQEENQKEKK